MNASGVVGIDCLAITVPSASDMVPYSIVDSCFTDLKIKVGIKIGN